jgi:hypothetical protein
MHDDPVIKVPHTDPRIKPIVEQVLAKDLRDQYIAQSGYRFLFAVWFFAGVISGSLFMWWTFLSFFVYRANQVSEKGISYLAANQTQLPTDLHVTAISQQMDYLYRDYHVMIYIVVPISLFIAALGFLRYYTGYRKTIQVVDND